MGGAMKYFPKKKMGHIFRSMVSYLGKYLGLWSLELLTFFKKIVKPSPPPPPSYIFNVRSLRDIFYVIIV